MSSVAELRRSSGQAGMTLVEVLIGVILFGLVTTAAFGFLSNQNESFTAGADRMDVLQNSRFAVNLVEQEARTAGSNTLEEQPIVVYAGASVLAFNGDLTSNIPDDPFTVYFDPDAPKGAVTAMTLAQRTTLPGTAFAYPDSAYTRSGTNSPAETIVLFFEPDPATARSDDFRLMRQVNDQEAELVARDLLQTGSASFFQYFWTTITAGGSPTVDAVSDSLLPLTHSHPIHGAAADSGAVGRIDDIRGVRIQFTATNGLSGSDERQRAITRLIRLPNANVVRRRVCGDKPILGTGLSATAATLPGAVPVIVLAWNAATDESGGERDVVRYVIWRRLASDTEWGDPYVSIPAGEDSYTWIDSSVSDGTSYVYAMAGQDCTPLQTSLATAGPITADENAPPIDDDDDDSNAGHGNDDDDDDSGNPGGGGG